MAHWSLTKRLTCRSAPWHRHRHRDRYERQLL